ncbi:hypothetical protein QJQ45_019013 [Haematococcus lacustris]|nr:hypothetical protein QJQ45_019013 [Haematococcus lacustris]
MAEVLFRFSTVMVCCAQLQTAGVKLLSDQLQLGYDDVQVVQWCKELAALLKSAQSPELSIATVALISDPEQRTQQYAGLPWALPRQQDTCFSIQGASQLSSGPLDLEVVLVAPIPTEYSMLKEEAKAASLAEAPRRQLSRRPSLLMTTVLSQAVSQDQSTLQISAGHSPGSMSADGSEAPRHGPPSPTSSSPPTLPAQPGSPRSLLSDIGATLPPMQLPSQRGPVARRSSRLSMVAATEAEAQLVLEQVQQAGQQPEQASLAEAPRRQLSRRPSLLMTTVLSQAVSQDQSTLQISAGHSPGSMSADGSEAPRHGPPSPTSSSPPTLPAQPGSPRSLLSDIGATLPPMQLPSQRGPVARRSSRLSMVAATEAEAQLVLEQVQQAGQQPEQASLAEAPRRQLSRRPSLLMTTVLSQAVSQDQSTLQISAGHSPGSMSADGSEAPRHGPPSPTSSSPPTLPAQPGSPRSLLSDIGATLPPMQLPSQRGPVARRSSRLSMVAATEAEAQLVLEQVQQAGQQPEQASLAEAPRRQLSRRPSLLMTTVLSQAVSQDQSTLQISAGHSPGSMSADGSEAPRHGPPSPTSSSPPTLPAQPGSPRSLLSDIGATLPPMQLPSQRGPVARRSSRLSMVAATEAEAQLVLEQVQQAGQQPEQASLAEAPRRQLSRRPSLLMTTVLSQAVSQDQSTLQISAGHSPGSMSADGSEAPRHGPPSPTSSSPPTLPAQPGSPRSLLSDIGATLPPMQLPSQRGPVARRSSRLSMVAATEAEAQLVLEQVQQAGQQPEQASLAEAPRRQLSRRPSLLMTTVLSQAVSQDQSTLQISAGHSPGSMSADGSEAPRHGPPSPTSSSPPTLPAQPGSPRSLLSDIGATLPPMQLPSQRGPVARRSSRLSMVAATEAEAQLVLEQAAQPLPLPSALPTTGAACDDTQLLPGNCRSSAVRSVSFCDPNEARKTQIKAIKATGALLVSIEQLPDPGLPCEVSPFHPKTITRRPSRLSVASNSQIRISRTGSISSDTVAGHQLSKTPGDVGCSGHSAAVVPASDRRRVTSGTPSPTASATGGIHRATPRTLSRRASLLSEAVLQELEDELGIDLDAVPVSPSDVARVVLRQRSLDPALVDATPASPGAVTTNHASDGLAAAPSGSAGPAALPQLPGPQCGGFAVPSTPGGGPPLSATLSGNCADAVAPAQGLAATGTAVVEGHLKDAGGSRSAGEEEPVLHWPAVWAQLQAQPHSEAAVQAAEAFLMNQAGLAAVHTTQHCLVPEVTLSGPGAASPASHVFLLGLLLYQLLTRTPDLACDPPAAKAVSPDGEMKLLPATATAPGPGPALTVGMPRLLAEPAHAAGPLRSGLAARLAQGWRPPLPESGLHPLAASLITRCWQQDPGARPSLSDVQVQLERLGEALGGVRAQPGLQAVQGQAMAAGAAVAAAVLDQTSLKPPPQHGREEEEEEEEYKKEGNKEGEVVKPPAVHGCVEFPPHPAAPSATPLPSPPPAASAALPGQALAPPGPLPSPPTLAQPAPHPPLTDATMVALVTAAAAAPGSELDPHPAPLPGTAPTSSPPGASQQVFTAPQEEPLLGQATAVATVQCAPATVKAAAHAPPPAPLQTQQPQAAPGCACVIC